MVGGGRGVEGGGGAVLWILTIFCVSDGINFFAEPV